MDLFGQVSPVVAVYGLLAEKGGRVLHGHFTCGLLFKLSVIVLQLDTFLGSLQCVALLEVETVRGQVCQSFV